MFEILEHTADIGFRARGRTRAELFANAALALQAIAVEMSDVRETELYSIDASGDDEESLLVNWLSEVLYYLDGKQVVMRRFEMEEPSPPRVVAKAWGEPRDPARQPGRLVVKGVTYHQLQIGKDTRGWYAQVYLDI